MHRDGQGLDLASAIARVMPPCFFHCRVVGVEHEVPATACHCHISNYPAASCQLPPVAIVGWTGCSIMYVHSVVHLSWQRNPCVGVVSRRPRGETCCRSRSHRNSWPTCEWPQTWQSEVRKSWRLRGAKRAGAFYNNRSCSP